MGNLSGDEIRAAIEGAETAVRCGWWNERGDIVDAARQLRAERDEAREHLRTAWDSRDRLSEDMTKLRARLERVMEMEKKYWANGTQLVPAVTVANELSSIRSGEGKS
jgi:DNA repair ATPase RecN